MARKRQLPSGKVRWIGEVKRELPSGEMYRSYQNHDTKREAEAFEARHQLLVEDAWAAARMGALGCLVPQPAPAPPSAQTLQAFADAVWWPQAERSLSPSTIYAYRSHWKRVEARWGAVSLDQITPEEVRSFAADYPGTKPARALTPLSSCLALAIEQGLLESNPVVAAGTFSAPRAARWVADGEELEEEEGEPLHHTPEELEAILAAWPWREYPVEGVAVLLGLKCALRLGEIRALRPEDVHLIWRDGRFVRGWLHVRRNRVRGPDGWVMKRPKNGRARLVPVPESVARALRPLTESARVGTTLLQRHGEPLDGSGSRSPIQRVLREIQEHLEILTLGVHDLRNTCMATWLANGVKPWNVSFWGAHGEGEHMAKVTRGHYTGTPEIDWADAALMEAHLTPEGRRARMAVAK